MDTFAGQMPNRNLDFLLGLCKHIGLKAWELITDLQIIEWRKLLRGIWRISFQSYQLLACKIKFFFLKIYRSHVLSSHHSMHAHVPNLPLCQCLLCIGCIFSNRTIMESLHIIDLFYVLSFANWMQCKEKLEMRDHTYLTISHLKRLCSRCQRWNARKMQIPKVTWKRHQDQPANEEKRMKRRCLLQCNFFFDCINCSLNSEIRTSPVSLSTIITKSPHFSYFHHRFFE